jgi:hypothetical protein
VVFRVRQRARGERREGEGDWLGPFDRPRIQSVGLDLARWARLANGPGPNFNYLKNQKGLNQYFK